MILFRIEDRNSLAKKLATARDIYDKRVSILEKNRDQALSAADFRGLKTFGLGNRRYLGSKSKLLSWIEKEIRESLGRNPKSLLDPFAGSGVISGHFAELKTVVHTNDLLLHNSIVLESFLLHKRYDYGVGCDLIAALGALRPRHGYIATNFGDKYFSMKNAMKLDSAREFISREIVDPNLQKFALTSFIYAADKIAQTVGHYDAFFNKEEVSQAVEFRAPLPVGKGVGHRVTNMDANELVENQSCEVIYLDPPYNSRQYGDAYHLLENLVLWEKPEVFGVAKKMNRDKIKSKYSSKQAFQAFDELVQSARCELLVLSYSNTGNARASRSNNILTDSEILNSLKSRGKVRTVEMGHKEFSTGSTSERKHQERLFICEVRN